MKHDIYLFTYSIYPLYNIEIVSRHELNKILANYLEHENPNNGPDDVGKNW